MGLKPSKGGSLTLHIRVGGGLGEFRLLETEGVSIAAGAMMAVGWG